MGENSLKKNSTNILAMSKFKRIVEEAKVVNEDTKWDSYLGFYQELVFKNGDSRRVYDNGITVYYDSSGHYHRTDGPAVISSKGEFYYVRGKELSKAEFDKHFGE